MKDKYSGLCAVEPSIPLFCQPWWLDATAGADNWDVALIEKNGVIQASMPYVLKSRFGFKHLSQPPLTQFLGPWIRKGTAKYAKELARQKDLYQEIISNLPHFDHFSQNWHYAKDNWLPFFWKGFSQTTRYTYCLPDLIDEDKLFSGFQENVRGDIRKSSSRFGVRVKTDVSLSEFYALNQLVFERQGMPMPYSFEIVDRIDQACEKRSCRRIFIAEDSEGRRHAGVYLVWDQNSAYYLMGGGDPELRNSGATSLCMWEAIKFASTVTNRFDFEGSMLEPVERFVRGFGAKQVPYFSISKTPSKILQIVLFARDFFKS